MVMARTLCRPITTKAKNIEIAAKLNERTIMTILENLEKLPDIVDFLKASELNQGGPTCVEPKFLP